MCRRNKKAGEKQDDTEERKRQSDPFTDGESPPLIVQRV
jgi:hypothetical protein